MNIVSVSAECAPFAKMGGLADVVAALNKEWNADGHSTCVILPKYGSIDTEKFGITPADIIVAVPVSSWTEYARVWKGVIPGSSAIVYFLENADYFDRDGIYGAPDGFSDNDRRFTFLCRAACELCIVLGVRVDVLHAHDYHAALCMAFLRIHYAAHPVFADCAGVYTIHNMAFQGQSDPRRTLAYADISPRPFRGSWFEHDGVVNLMKTGLMFADKITTVSPSYANEIRWTRNGEGMQEYVAMRSGDVIGVLNGADYDEWNPSSDTYLDVHYTVDDISSKQELKRHVLRGSLPAHDDTPHLPLIGMVSRLTSQKGIDLLEAVAEAIITSGRARLVLLGSGDSSHEAFFRRLGHRHPSRALVHIGYDNAISHAIIAGSDFLLVPSLFEPCGLTQLYAMKYGTVPIVRATGGLRDTVDDYDAVTGKGTGFVFERYAADALFDCVQRALSLYEREPHWNTLRANAMSVDYSSRRCALAYLEVFNAARERRRSS